MDARTREEVNRLVEQGVAAARAERKEEAEEWLSQAVALDPQNEQAWLWLSAVVEGIQAQRDCLRRVLEINPANPFARNGLSFLSHLREGYEYLAARAPWVRGLEEDSAALASLPVRSCPHCGAPNPGWAYICSRCLAALEPLDVAQIARKEWRRRPAPSLVRPWPSAAVLDARHAFSPEIALASPARAVLTIVFGALALNLLRTVWTLGLIALARAGQPLLALDQLMAAFLRDQAGLLLGALATWLLLASLTQGIARAQGGLGSPMVHFSLTAVAVSAWMPIAGVVGVLWWTVAVVWPQLPLPWLVALGGGLCFFYAVTLLAQAAQTAHNLQPLGETAAIGLLLTACTAGYAGLAALNSPTLQTRLLAVAQVLLMPLLP